MRKLKIKKGQKFGGLTVIEEIHPLRLPCGQTNRIFLMQCDCGNKKIIRLLHFIRGRIKTCSHRNHGDIGINLHNIWRGIKVRCKESEYVKNHFNSYYRKNIRMYKGWEEYKSFKKWALKNGYKEGLIIDRIDTFKGYYPDNCRFVNNVIQSNNKENTIYIDINNQKKPLKIAIDEKGLTEHYHAIYNRIKRGWNAERALKYPIKIGGGRIPNNIIRN